MWLKIVSCSSESCRRVKDILEDVEKLTKFERLLLYMDLPSNNAITDPLRQ